MFFGFDPTESIRGIFPQSSRRGKPVEDFPGRRADIRENRVCTLNMQTIFSPFSRRE